jgi:hypothetical protein
VQRAGGNQPWKKEVDKAAVEFFSQPLDNSGVDAYTGRVK